MALNFLGLGFSLGAEDKGLGKAIKETSSGLADIGKSVIGIGLSSAKMIFTPPKFGPSVALAQTLANDIKLTTTGIEAFGVAASKATSAGLAGLNMTEKEFKAAQGMISSTAFSMNTDVGAVTKSFTALKQSSVDVKKFGFKSFQDYQKFIEVTGTDSVAFASAIGTMNTQMKMTPKQVTASLKSVAAIGKKFNIGREAVAGMAETVQLLNNNAKLLPHQWGPDKMANFLKGTTIVAGALTSVGMTADEAMTASRKLTEKLLEGSKGLSGLYSGLETDLPDVYDVVTQNLGDMESAFKMLSESPDQFVLKMGTIVDKVGKMNLDPKNMDRFRLQMEKTFGTEVMSTFTKEGFSKIGPAIKNASKPIKGQEEILQDLSKRYQDGRTMAERFAIAQDMVQTKLKQVHGVMSDTKFLASYNSQSKDFLKTVNKLADKGGALGKLTTSLIEVKNRGLGGFLSAHSKFGFALAEGLKLIQPMLQYLPALAVAFKALLSPVTLVAGAFAGLFFLFKDLGKGEQSVVRAWADKMAKDAPRLWAKAKEIFGKAFDVIADVVKQIPWAKVGQVVIDGFTWAFNGVIKVIDLINWGKVGDLLGEALRRTVELAFTLAFKAIDLIGRFIDWFAGLNWNKIGNYVGKIIVGIFAVAVDLIWTVIKRIPAMFVAVIDMVLGALDGIEDAISAKFPILGALIGPFIAMLKVVVVPVLIGLGLHFVAVGVKAVYAAVTSGVAWVKATAQIVAGSLSAIAAQAQLVYAFLATKVASMQTGLAMAKAWVIGLGPIAWVVAAVIGLGVVIYKFGAEIKWFFGKLWDAVKVIFKLAWDAIVGIVTLPIRVIKIIWSGIKGFFKGLLDSLKSIFTSPMEAIKAIILAPITAVKLAWGGIKGFFGGLWSGIKSQASEAWSGIKGALSSAWSGIKGIFGGSSSSGGKSLSQIVQEQMDKAKTATENMSKDAAKTASKSIELVGSTAKGIREVTVQEIGKSSSETVTANKNTAAAVDSFVNKTDEHLKKAGKLVFPKLTGDEDVDKFQKFAKIQAEIEQRQKEFNIIRGVNLQNLNAEELKGLKQTRERLLLGKDFSDESVRRAKELEGLRSQAKGFSAEIDKAFGKSGQYLWDRGGMDKISAGFTQLDAKAAQMEVTSRKSMEERIAQRKAYYLGEELRLRSLHDTAVFAGDDLTKLNKQMADLSAARQAEVGNLSAEIAAMNGKQMTVIKDLGASLETWVRAERTTVKSASEQFVKQFGPDSDAVKAVMDGQKKIDESYDVSLTKIKNNAQSAAKEARELYKTQPEQLKVALKKINEDLTSSIDKAYAEHEGLVKSFRSTATANIAGIKDNSAGAIAVISEAADLAQKKIDETAKAGADKVAKHATDTKHIVSEELKLGANDAAESIARISVINPKDFRAGIRMIKDELIKALQAMDDQGQKMIKSVQKNIQKFFEDSKKGWNDQETLIKTFSDKAVAHTEKYWTKVLDEASRATTAFTNLFKSIQSSLVSMATSVNVMDLLASPSQISRWAASVVAALSYAFRTGGAMDAQIAAAYNKALEASSAATPDTAETRSPAAPATSQQAMLLNAINRPVWATEEKQLIPSQLIEMNEQLKQTLAQLKALAETKSAGRAGGKSISPKS